MENMVVEVPPQVRLVRCPKCRNLLPEPPGVPLYSCGGCGTFLQAKTKKRSDAGKTGVDPHDEKGFPNDINELRREENAVASPEEDSSSNKIALKTEKQSSAFALDREESSCREKTEATREDNSCSNQSLSLESGSSNSELVENVFDPPHHDDVEEQKEYAERLSLYQSMEAAVDISSSVSIANIEHPHEGNEAKENGCCSNQSLQIEDDTAAMDYLSPRAEPLVEEEEENRNCDDEVEVEATVADNVSSDQSIGTVNQMVAASNVSTSDIIIVQEAAQNDGSNRSSSFNAKETARETICQETISSFAMEEQFQNLDTYVGVRRQELNVGISNVSEMQPTRRTHNEELELLRSGEEIFFISKEEKKLREELLLLNHQTPDDDSVSEMLMIKGLDPVRATHQTRHRTRSESYNQCGPCYGEGASNQEREKFLYRSKLHSEQDKTELLRIMVLQLEAQVRRMRHSGHSTSETETVSVEMNRFYSETLDRPRTQFSQPYSFPSSGFSSPQQPRRYYSPSRSWDFETNSVDQLSSNSKFSYQQRKRVHVPKRHVRAVAGGSPVITCYRCLAMLQLPEDFLLSKRKRFHWLKCGSCLTVLRFSLQNGTHIIPYREGGGYDEIRKKGTEARRNRSSALHKLMGYSSVTQLVIRSGESSPSDQTSV